jgi:oxygen-independent coproporphyrinogen-3 oxidase
MYLIVNDYLDKKGYKRYEISNFAIEGFESKHNLNYWNNNEYYGFGVAAHGYVNNCRYSNTENLDEYLKNPHLRKNLLQLSINEQLEEEIFLNFRKAEGINIKTFEEKFGISFFDKYKNVLNKYMPDYIEKTDSGYKLTLNGVLLSNIILSDFLD